jgi:hypothetical protein
LARSSRFSAPVALEDLDGGRLAGPVRAEQEEDLAARNLEADAAHRLGLAIGLAQIAYLDGQSFAGDFDGVLHARQRRYATRRA